MILAFTEIIFCAILFTTTFLAIDGIREFYNAEPLPLQLRPENTHVPISVSCVRMAGDPGTYASRLAGGNGTLGSILYWSEATGGADRFTADPATSCTCKRGDVYYMPKLYRVCEEPIIPLLALYGFLALCIFFYRVYLMCCSKHSLNSWQFHLYVDQAMSRRPQLALWWLGNIITVASLLYGIISAAKSGNPEGGGEGVRYGVPGGSEEFYDRKSGLSTSGDEGLNLVWLLLLFTYQHIIGLYFTARIARTTDTEIFDRPEFAADIDVTGMGDLDLIDQFKAVVLDKTVLFDDLSNALALQLGRVDPTALAKFTSEPKRLEKLLVALAQQPADEDDDDKGKDKTKEQSNPTANSGNPATTAIPVEKVDKNSNLQQQHTAATNAHSEGARKGGGTKSISLWWMRLSSLLFLVALAVNIYSSISSINTFFTSTGVTFLNNTEKEENRADDGFSIGIGCYSLYLQPGVNWTTVNWTMREGTSFAVQFPVVGQPLPQPGAITPETSTWNLGRACNNGNSNPQAESRCPMQITELYFLLPIAIFGGYWILLVAWRLSLWMCCSGFGDPADSCCCPSCCCCFPGADWRAELYADALDSRPSAMVIWIIGVLCSLGVFAVGVLVALTVWWRRTLDPAALGFLFLFLFNNSIALKFESNYATHGDLRVFEEFEDGGGDATTIPVTGLPGDKSIWSFVLSKNYFFAELKQCLIQDLIAASGSSDRVTAQHGLADVTTEEGRPRLQKLMLALLKEPEEAAKTRHSAPKAPPPPPHGATAPVPVVSKPAATDEQQPPMGQQQQQESTKPAEKQQQQKHHEGKPYTAEAVASPAAAAVEEEMKSVEAATPQQPAAQLRPAT